MNEPQDRSDTLKADNQPLFSQESIKQALTDKSNEEFFLGIDFMIKDDISAQDKQSEVAQNCTTNGENMTKSDKKEPEYKFSGSEKTVANKMAMVVTMKEHNYFVGFSCDQVGISRETHNTWTNTDPEYKRAIEEALDYTIDEYELMLKKQAMSGDTAAITFFLKTKGRKRGYAEVQKIEIESNEEDFKKRLDRFKELSPADKKKFIAIAHGVSE